MKTENILSLATGAVLGYLIFKPKAFAIGNSLDSKKVFLNVDGLTYTLYKSGTKKQVEEYVNRYGIPKEAAHVITIVDGEHRLYMRFKSKEAKRALQLMDHDIDYKQAVEIAIAESNTGTSKYQLEKELDLYI